MELFVDILSWACIVVGGAFAVIGGIGLFRFPDFYTRMHAAGITDTMGASLIMLALAFQAGVSLITFKIIMILFFLLITSPTSAHALANSARVAGVEPELDDGQGKGGVSPSNI